MLSNGCKKRLKRLKRLELGPALDIADVWVEDAIAAKGRGNSCRGIGSRNTKS